METFGQIRLIFTKLSQKLRLISLFSREIGSCNIDSAVMSFLVNVESIIYPTF